MTPEDKGLWHYYKKWSSIAKGQAPLVWKGSRLDNAWCADCRFCCGQQDNPEPFPMALLPGQIGPETPDDFYMLDECTASLDERGCKALGARGCKLSIEKRPLACGLFPIVLINGCLYLYQICPAAIFLPLAHFYELAAEAAAFLETFSRTDLERISISLPEETLLDRYINLHIRIFDRDGKKTIFR